MKANNVKTEPDEVAGQKCCECNKPLMAPWGRVDHGKKWVCSHTCHELYKYKLQGIDNNVVLVRRLTAG